MTSEPPPSSTTDLDALDPGAAPADRPGAADPAATASAEEASLGPPSPGEDDEPAPAAADDTPPHPPTDDTRPDAPAADEEPGDAELSGEEEEQLAAGLPDAPTERLEFIGGAAPRPEPGEAPADVAEARRAAANLLFATTQPLSLRRLSALLGGLTYECVRSIVGDVARDAPALGLQVRAVAGGYQLATSPDCAEWVWKLSRRKPEAPLSPAALETLAIVAYKQPATKAEIDVIRGVESGAVVRHLVELELLTVAGRREVPGRPLIYKTTRRFLKMFGLARVADLPPIQELKKLYRERERQRGDEEARAQAERRRAEREEALGRLRDAAAAGAALPPPPEVRDGPDLDDTDDEAEGELDREEVDERPLGAAPTAETARGGGDESDD